MSDTTRTVSVESGHVSLEVNTNAKGEYQYAAKIVLPITVDEHGEVLSSEVESARIIAQVELEHAEAFLRARYGRKEATP